MTVYVKEVSIPFINFQTNFYTVRQWKKNEKYCGKLARGGSAGSDAEEDFQRGVRQSRRVVAGTLVGYSGMYIHGSRRGARQPCTVDGRVYAILASDVHYSSCASAGC